MINSSTNGSPKTSREQLDAALRAIWDVMEFYEWYLTKDTAKGAKENALFGDKITAAIHKRFLTKEVVSAIKTQLDYWQERKIIESLQWTDEIIKWNFLKVIDTKGNTITFEKPLPVELKLLQRRYGFFDFPDPITYNFDDYKLANPFNRYWKARFIVR